MNARNMFLGMAAQSPILAQVRPDGLEDAPQIRVDIDREKANALGVPFDSINAVISTAMGSSYVNDFPNRGRMQRVIVQAEAAARMQPDELLKLNAMNVQGQPVPLSAFATVSWVRVLSKACAITAIRPCEFPGHLHRATARVMPWKKCSA